MAKLVEILARELREWPNGWIAVGQACDGSLHGKPFDGRYTGEKYSVCDRYIAEEVTRAEWQAAVDALDIPKFPGDNPEWNGEGLPPVGAFCGYQYVHHGGAWYEGEILYVSDEYTIIKGHQVGEQHYYTRNLEFRPIRTPEQIAAEEREKAAYIMMVDAGVDDKEWSRQLCLALYDAGYRKQESK